MPRYARFHVTGGLFHVISRFHDRQFFLDLEGARSKYLELLGRAAEKHDSRIIAYSSKEQEIIDGILDEVAEKAEDDGRRSSSGPSGPSEPSVPQPRVLVLRRRR